MSLCSYNKLFWFNLLYNNTSYIKIVIFYYIRYNQIHRSVCMVAVLRSIIIPMIGQDTYLLTTTYFTYEKIYLWKNYVLLCAYISTDNKIFISSSIKILSNIV